MEVGLKKGAHGGNMVSPVVEFVPKLTELVRQMRGG
jgi:hypothetical protein